VAKEPVTTTSQGGGLVLRLFDKRYDSCTRDSPDYRPVIELVHVAPENSINLSLSAL
jgi:hypothetical protein